MKLFSFLIHSFMKRPFTVTRTLLKYDRIIAVFDRELSKLV